LWPRLDRPSALLAAVVGAAVALLAAPVLPAGAPVLLAGLGAVAGWIWERRAGAAA
jgi:hypothetical protein